MSICCALNGKISIKHELHGVLVREDGFVLVKRKKGPAEWAYVWTAGYQVDGKYLYVGINYKSYRVHRLVAECFCPNPDHKKTVDHIDQNKMNNCASNLRWATLSEQQDNVPRLKKLKYGIRKTDNPAEWDSRRKAAYRKAAKSHHEP